MKIVLRIDGAKANLLGKITGQENSISFYERRVSLPTRIIRPANQTET
jgi:hypothetical protein